jgi:hypothetical protein
MDDGCMGAWTHGRIDAWMMDAWVHGRMDAWMHNSAVSHPFPPKLTLP